MSHIHWVARQNKLVVPRDKDEVNKWEIHEWNGWAHDPDTMVVPLTTFSGPKIQGANTFPILLFMLLFIINRETES